MNDNVRLVTRKRTYTITSNIKKFTADWNEVTDLREDETKNPSSSSNPSKTGKHNSSNSSVESTLKQKIASLKRENEKLKENYTNQTKLKENIEDKFKQENLKNERKFKNFSEEKSSLEKEIEKLKDHIKIINSTVCDKNNKSNNSENNDSHKIITKLENKVKNRTLHLQEANTNLEQKNRELAEKDDELKQKIASLRRENEKLKENYTNQTKLKENIEDKFKQENLKNEKKIKNLNEEKRSLEKEIEKLKDHIKIINSTVCDKNHKSNNSEKNDSHKIITKLENKVKNTTLHLQEANTNLEQKNRELAEKDDELKQYKIKLAENNLKLKELETKSDNDLIEYESELSKKEKEIIEMENARDEYERVANKAIESLDKKLEDCEITIQNQNKELDKISEILRQEEGNKLSLVMENKSLEASLKEAEASKKDLAQKEQELRKNLESINLILEDKCQDLQGKNTILHENLKKEQDRAACILETSDLLKINNSKLHKNLETLQKILNEKKAAHSQFLNLQLDKLIHVQDKLESGRVEKLANNEHKICENCKVLENKILELETQTKNNGPKKSAQNQIQNKKNLIMNHGEAELAKNNLLLMQKLHENEQQLKDSKTKIRVLEARIKKLQMSSDKCCICNGNMKDLVPALKKEISTLQKELKTADVDKIILQEKLDEANRTKNIEHFEKMELYKRRNPN